MFENSNSRTLHVEKAHTLTGHRDSVYALVGVPGTDAVFSADGKGTIVRWNLREPDRGYLVAQLPRSVYAMALNPASQQLLVGHNFEGIHEIDWQRKKEIRSLRLTGAAIFDLLIVGDHLWVATGDGELIVIHLPAWSIVHRMSFSTRSARTLAYHPARNELIAGFSDQHIRVMDAQTGKIRNEWPAHGNSVFALALSPDGRLLLSGGRDARLRAWAPHANYQPGEEVAAHLFAINHIVFSPDGQFFVTCSMDKSIKVWSAREARLLRVLDKSRYAGHGHSVNRLFWAPDSSQVVSASDDGTLAVWNFTPQSETTTN